MEEKSEKAILIGLTGGIGSGKTTVAKIIEENGFPVYNSDNRAKELVNESDYLKNKIISFLGEKAYDENGIYDTKYVSGKVFADSELLEKLNQTIHPAVKQDFKYWTSIQNGKIIFKETALLFELGINKQCDKSLLVTAEDNIRFKRVMDRDDKTYREVEKILEKQMPEKEKIRKADFIIYNNSTLKILITETEKVLQEILEKLE